MQTLQDTIVAPATPPGEGAIGIIRLSGADAIAMTARMFRGKDLNVQPAHTLHYGAITDGRSVVDEVVVSLYRAPASYTGEDTIEISCHGSQYVLNRVLELCLAQGARMARPGEFTQRAFLNGKIDLTQAEAVADLIAAQSGGAHRAAIHNLRGGFSHDLAAMREELIQFSALIELELDFSEEDVEFADRSRFYALIAHLTQEISRLLQSFRLGNVIRNGVKVAIVGQPNAGKSTLLNALLHEERAIVSEIAGTTRDTIEETLNIGGILFRLIDTAGIRTHTTDTIEEQGIARSRDAMQKADIIIHLYDAADGAPEPLAPLPPDVHYLPVGNKADQLEALPCNDHLYIAAKTGENIALLKEKLLELATGNQLQTEATIITNARHYQALQHMLQALTDIKAGLDSHLPGDLLSSDIRQCLYYLGEITGTVTNEDKLDYIFSKFCIGK